MTTDHIDYFYNWQTHQSDDPDWKGRRLQAARVTCDGIKLTHVSYCQAGKYGYVRRYPVNGEGRIAQGSEDKEFEVRRGKVVVEFGEDPFEGQEQAEEAFRDFDALMSGENPKRVKP